MKDWLKEIKPKYRLAVSSLVNDADIRKNNIPINLKEGNVEQAKLEKQELASYKNTIKALRQL